MHGTLPLARLIHGFPQPSASRIPHLTFHILRRQSACSSRWDPRSCLHDSRQSRRVRRSSTLTGVPTSTSPLSALKDFVSTHSHDDVKPNDTLAQGSVVAGRNMATMQELLEENSPERILLGLVTPHIGDDFIKYANEELFTRAICALDPDYFLVPHLNIYRYLKTTLETQPKFRMVKSLEERVGSFINILDTLITRRQEHGHPLNLDIYRHLLRCAGVVGAGSFARNMFQQIMPENNVEPDLQCYNHFMQALTWNEAHNRYERYRLRIVAHNMMRRATDQRPVGYQGHGVASPTSREKQESVRLEILGIFNDLVRQGLEGNEETFCNLMVAMGREGDVGSVKSVLKSVWNIDVEALDKFDEEELESPTFYEEGTPLRPSARLLSTVVHIFAVNNEVALGGMLLDYISRNYNLEIPEDTWTHLLEWTYVLSIQHSKSRREQGLASGRIARRAVDSVYHVFHNEPYNVQPKIVDLIFSVKARSNARQLQLTLDNLRECMVLLEEERTRVSELYDQLRSWLAAPDHYKIFWDGLPSAEFLELKRSFIMASLHLDRDLQLILVAVRNTFKRKDWITEARGLDWAYRGLPDMVAEWHAWLPDVVPYYTPTGHVRLVGRHARHKAIESANSTQTTETGVMRWLLDTYSPRRLRHAVKFVHQAKKRVLLHEFRDELEHDTQGVFSDWILRFEQTQRGERLKARQVATSVLNMPGPDINSRRWKPWGRHRNDVHPPNKAAPARRQEQSEQREVIDDDATDVFDGGTDRP